MENLELYRFWYWYVFKNFVVFWWNGIKDAIFTKRLNFYLAAKFFHHSSRKMLKRVGNTVIISTRSNSTVDTGCRVALPRGSERKWRAQPPEPVSWLSRAGNSGSCREKEKRLEEGWYFSGLWRARDGRKWSSLRRKFSPLAMGGKKKIWFLFADFSDFELFYLTRGRILGQNPHKRLFLFAIHSHLYSFALRFIFPQTHATSYVFLLFSYCTL